MQMQLYKKFSYENNFTHLEKKHETSLIYTYTNLIFQNKLCFCS